MTASRVGARRPMVSRRARLVGVGLLALVAAGILGSGVPLFDGIGFPDDPYRYVSPPAGAVRTPAPVAPSVTADTSTGTNPQGFEVASTPEQGPQVSIYVPASALLPAAGARSVTVTATPLAATGIAPPNGAITGNVYRVTAVSGGAAVELATGTAGTITLRAPVGFKVIPVMDFRAPGSTTWTRVQTTRVGNDIFESAFSRLGDYATVLPTDGSSASGGASRTVLIVLAGFAGIGLLVIAVVRGFRSIGDAPDLADAPDASDGSSDDLDE